MLLSYVRNKGTEEEKVKVPSGNNPAKKGVLGAEPVQDQKGRQTKRDRQTERHHQTKTEETKRQRKNTKEDKREELTKEQGPHQRPKPEEVGVLTVRTPTCPLAAP